MKTSELSGALLDYWVARACGWTVGRLGHQSRNDPVPRGFYGAGLSTYGMEISKFRPSTDWSQGGPIIDLMRIELWAPCERGTFSKEWRANTEWGPSDGYSGPTPLIAAMRAFVASKLGDEVTDEVE